ncbi:hypothetical protein B484DRAFT_448208 [Ochromonadaceae sp. CCMP2298]|nr:hypothetical protein B484DRAFT_448208 [Ochromonadaceae sp. CCMP2298]
MARFTQIPRDILLLCWSWLEPRSIALSSSCDKEIRSICQDKVLLKLVAIQMLGPLTVAVQKIRSLEEIAVTMAQRSTFGSSKMVAVFFSYASLRLQSTAELQKLKEIAELVYQHPTVEVIIESHVGTAAPVQAAREFGKMRAALVLSQLEDCFDEVLDQRSRPGNLKDNSQVSQLRVQTRSQSQSKMLMKRSFASRVTTRNWAKKVSTAGQWENDEFCSRCEVFFRLPRQNQPEGGAEGGEDDTDEAVCIEDMYLDPHSYETPRRPEEYRHISVDALNQVGESDVREARMRRVLTGMVEETEDSDDDDDDDDSDSDDSDPDSDEEGEGQQGEQGDDGIWGLFGFVSETEENAPDGDMDDEGGSDSEEETGAEGEDSSSESTQEYSEEGQEWGPQPAVTTMCGVIDAVSVNTAQLQAEAYILASDDDDDSDDDFGGSGDGDGGGVEYDDAVTVAED